MDQIYETMKINNMNKISMYGLNYDPLLLCECDKRYCLALFTIPNNNNTYLTNEFYLLQNLLSKENVGITYFVGNNNTNNGTFHFTFMQKIKFDAYNGVSPNIIDKYYNILNNLVKPYLPFKIIYNKLILVQNGLVLCGNASIDINSLRDEYRKECEINELPLNEPYYLNIMHSTLFRFTCATDNKKFIEKYKHYLDNDIEYGYIIIDHINIGSASWKVNNNEIDIMKIIK